MTSNPTAVDVFVVSVFKRNLSLNINSIKKVVKEEIKQKPSRHISNVGGDQFDLSPELFLDLKNNILENGYLYLEHLGYCQKEVELNSLWLNINGYKDYNLVHNHGNSLLSGVFYIQVPSKSGKITFVNSSQRLELYDKYIESGYTPYNSSKWGFKPKENELFLFPAWLDHYVEPNLNKSKKRISLAFNLNYK
tara:strand:+ start:553 stop:1131 length:579 start_codon:yes stop_codon:yes gene_type:complete